MSTNRPYRLVARGGGSPPSTTYLFSLDEVERHLAVRQQLDSELYLFAPDGALVKSWRPPAAVAVPTLPKYEDVERAQAQSKLEAVTRLGRLCGIREQSLGPGSKERKSVLIDLATALRLEVDADLPKPQLGAQLAGRLGTTWDARCWSTGSTVTLLGLNRLLLAAERRNDLRTNRIELEEGPEAEASLLLAALAEVLPSHMDGRSCVREMQETGYDQWAQDEWAGFYFEYRGLNHLSRTVGGVPVRYANTRFDYSWRSVWDLKWHSDVHAVAPLNDAAAIDACLAERGLGFLMLSGEVAYDDGDFRTWFRQFRSEHGKTPRLRAHAPSYVRRSKAAFRPRLLEAFYLPDEAALASALSSGACSIWRPGRQTSGAARKPKYQVHLRKARHSMLVARHEFT